MAKVETQQEADELNRTETYGPYQAANGHLMYASLRFPRETYETGPDAGNWYERDYRIGDEISYTTWDAWCAPECNHRELGPLEDW